MSGPRIGELFAGYGGLGMGVQQVYGGEVVWVSEFDKGPSKILAHRFPGVPNYGDITAIDWAQVEPVDILTGGYPCQPFSQAGRRDGPNDDRHLWPHVATAIGILRPPIVIFENVRGHLTLGFDEVLRDLSLLHYDTTWTTIKAADVGAPHNRARIFVIGRNRGRQLRSRTDRWGGLRRDSRGWRINAGSPQGEHDRQGAACPSCDGVDVRRQIGTGPGCHRDHPRHLHLAAEREAGRPTPRSTGSSAAGEVRSCSGRPLVPVDGGLGREAPQWSSEVDRGDETEGAGIPRTDPGGESSRPGPRDAESCSVCSPPTGCMVRAGGRSVRPGGVSWALPDQRDAALGSPLRHDVELLPTPVAQEPGGTVDQYHARLAAADGRESTFIPLGMVTKWGDYAAAIARWEHVIGRPAPEPTMTSSKGNAQLSPAFVEWMMGLPAGWVTDVPGITRNEALKALGNGVVPQQAAEALRVMATWGEVAA